MIQIEYGPVHSRLRCSNGNELKLADKLLSKEFTYQVPGYVFSPRYMSMEWDGRKTFYHTGHHKFLSGLLSMVLRVLNGAEFDVEVNGYPAPLVAPTAPIYLFPDITLYDYQMHAVRQVLKYHRGIVKVATNGGKTEVMGGILKATHMPPSIVVVPRLEIFTQTVERLQTRLNIDVGMAGGGKWLLNPKGVTVAMFQTVLKNIDKADTKRWLNGAQNLFDDECHFLSDAGLQKVVGAIPAPLRVFMSGTPFKESIIEQMNVRGYAGPVLCTVGNKELIDRGVSVKPKIVFLEPKLTWIEKKQMEHGTWDTTLYNCGARNQLIGNLAMGFVATGRQTVVMVNRVEHGLQILKHTPGAVFVHSQSGNRKQVKKRLESGEAFICICTSIFDTGLSVDYMEALILAGGGSAAHTLLQRLGRLLRRAKNRDKDIWCIDFWDTFNRITRSHSRDRWEIFKAEGAFDMMEGPDHLPQDVVTEVWEGAGAERKFVQKSRKAKWQN